MRVFVTGATGFVGSAVVRDLIAAGHRVTGLARSDAGAGTLAAMGAEVHRGSLEDHASLRSGAAASDGVLHLGFNHDFSKFLDNCELDRRAILALGEELRAPTARSSSPQACAARARTARDRGRRGRETFPACVRIGGAVARRRPRRRGSASTVHAWRGRSRLRSDPHQSRARERRGRLYRRRRQPLAAAHRIDAARVYRLALEQGATAKHYHAIAEEGVPFKAIAEVIGRRLGVPVVSKSADEAEAHFGWFARFATIDVPTSSAKTRPCSAGSPKKKG